MEQIVTLDNLYIAFHKACRGKQHKTEVLDFVREFDVNMHSLRQQLVDGTFAFGGYRYFTIRDPKERLICAAPFRERIAHHALMNVCGPYFDRTLIDSTYATRKGKGVYAALDAAVKAMSYHRYSVKLDIRKFYDSIDHLILKQKLRRIFKDAELMRIFDAIIDSYAGSDGKGLPIGNLTSQYFANVYLSDLDHRAKEHWKADVYIRYMDDILILSDDKNVLKQCVGNVCSFSETHLALTFKPPIFRDCSDGQVFLGYKVMPYKCVLSGRSKKRFRTKMLKYEKMLLTGRWDEQTYAEHILPLEAFIRYADSLKFRQSCIDMLNGDSRRVDRTA